MEAPTAAAVRRCAPDPAAGRRRICLIHSAANRENPAADHAAELFMRLVCDLQGDARLATGALAPIIRTPLPPHPSGRVFVPFMTRVGQAAKRRFDFVQAALNHQFAADQFRDESAPVALADAPVQFGNCLLVQSDLYAHRVELSDRWSRFPGRMNPVAMRN